MQIRQILKEDNAVSPVIGVILMVAITVILAAVIATFVLGLGDNLSNTAPQASFGTDYDSGELTITHDGGDSIAAEELYVRGDVNHAWTDTDANGNSFAEGSKISAGHSITLDNIDDSTSVSIVWELDEGGNSATLGKWSGPDA